MKNSINNNTLKAEMLDYLFNHFNVIKFEEKNITDASRLNASDFEVTLLCGQGVKVKINFNYHLKIQKIKCSDWNKLSCKFYKKLEKLKEWQKAQRMAIGYPYDQA
jgi:hypothetical protein